MIDEERLLVHQNYTSTEVSAIGHILKERFQAALNKGPATPELLQALGVISIIDRDYNYAVECFQQSLNLDPTNHLMWNKLGAALVHVGLKDMALKAYQTALDLKPNYVRVWINLGKLYSNQVKKLYN